jgi:hypothetical protein
MRDLAHRQAGARVRQRGSGLQGALRLRLSLAVASLCEILLDLRMQAGVKLFLAFRMPLLIKVMLVGGQCLFAFPFHVLDEVSQSSLDAPRVVFALS